MPIYTALAVSTDRTPHPLFRQRGLDNLTAAPLSAITIAGIPHERQVAYQMYEANIEAFLFATSKGERVACRVPSFSITPEKDLIPLQLPSVAFTFKDKVGRDTLDKFVEKFKRMNPEILFKAGSDQVVQRVIVHDPTPEVADILPKLASPVGVAHSNQIHPRFLPEARRMMNLVTLFLRTQTYPAYYEAAPTQQTSFHRNMAIFTPGNVAVTAKDLPAFQKAVTSHMPAFETMVSKDPKASWNITTITSTGAVTGSDIVVTAKPSPLPYTFNCGPPSEVPTLPGLLLPYFAGMTLPDHTSLYNLITARFSRLFGADIVSLQEGLASLRQATPSIASTTFGLAITHIFLGINLALKTQTRLFIIIDEGVYLGLCLLGERFEVQVNTKWYAPVSADILQSEVALLGTHSLAVMKIVEVLNNCQGRTIEEVEDVWHKDITTSAELLRVMSLRKLEATDMEAIRPWMGLLRFGPYKRFSVENITWALAMLGRSDLTVDSLGDLPFFLPADLEHVEDPRFLTLACFGPDAFSFLNSRGKEYKIPPPRAPTGASNLPYRTEDLPEKIRVSVKGVKVCFEDWKIVWAKRAIRMDLQERGGGSRNMEFLEDQRSRLWAGLVLSVGAAPSASVLKRKIRDDDEDAEERLDKVARIDDILDLL